MNLDDPKLTAYALGELDGPERGAIARAVAESPEAQRFVEETRGLAQALSNEFAAELVKETLPAANPRKGAFRVAHACRRTGDRRSLIDIRDDPWFWSIARPLAIAAVIAFVALIGAISVSTYRRGGTANRASQVASNGRDSLTIELPSALAPANAKPFPDVDAELVPPAATPPVNANQQLLATTGDDKTDIVIYSELYNRGAIYSRDASSRMKSVPMSAAVAGQPAPFSSELDRTESVGGIHALNGEFNTAAYDHILENPFLDAASNPLSTFSIDVDTASYSNIRRFINQGSLPPKDAVRLEEMINYFTYDYPQPTDDKPFSINVDVAGCPWEASHRLVRIGLKGREIAVDKRGASNLVFLLDVSGSMTPPERLPLVKQAMRLLVEKLTENDRVAIVVYAGASGLALPSTTGDHKEQILSTLESLQPGGSTNGADGIQLAYKVAADNFIKGGVNRVILATDGDFNVGVTNQGDLIRLIQEKAKTGVFLSVLGVGTDNLKDSTMQKLADKGNGNYAYLDSLEEARKVLVQQMNGTLVTIAKDVKIQVEFNPARVASYRLVGYEKRMLRKEDFNNDKIDAGEIGAGHTVTALYEVVPVGASANPAASVPPVDPLKYSRLRQGFGAAGTSAADTSASSDELLTVKLRHKKPDGDKSELVERAVVDGGAGFEKASADFKFAAAVAEFGMLLRDSEHKGSGTLGAVLEWAQEGKGSDPNGYRAGFIELVRKAQALSKG
jgi:Ca-activated chloride channel family protein